MSTITIDRAVLEQALEALEAMKAEFRALDLPYGSKAYAAGNQAAHGLRAALAQQEQEPEPPTQAGALHAMKTVLWKQEQEPVAWNPAATPLEFETECAYGTRFLNVAEMPNHAVRWRVVAPPRREWRGLTMQEINALPEVGGRMWNMGVAEAVLQAIRAVEAKLKEKNHE